MNVLVAPISSNRNTSLFFSFLWRWGILRALEHGFYQTDCSQVFVFYSATAFISCAYARLWRLPWTWHGYARFIQATDTNWSWSSSSERTGVYVPGSINVSPGQKRNGENLKPLLMGFDSFHWVSSYYFQCFALTVLIHAKTKNVSQNKLNACRAIGKLL